MNQVVLFSFLLHQIFDIDPCFPLLVGDLAVIYVAADIGQVAADAGQVAADAGQVAADTGQVAADAGQVAADAGQVASDVQRSTVNFSPLTVIIVNGFLSS